MKTNLLSLTKDDVILIIVNQFDDKIKYIKLPELE
jgi:hypothetical protein